MAQNRNRNWHIVINADTLPKNAEISKKLAETNIKNYAYITHNKDENKKPHIHLILEYENARTFDSLQKKFETWHIEPCKSLVLSLQYLTHKNDKNKEQYEPSEIVTNNPEWLEKNYNLENDYINDERQLIQELLKGKYKSYFELILSNDYSLEWLNRRRQTILDLFEAIKQEAWKK